MDCCCRKLKQCSTCSVWLLLKQKLSQAGIKVSYFCPFLYAKHSRVLHLVSFYAFSMFIISFFGRQGELT